MISPTDKIVVLARGLGTRMRRADATAPLSPQQAAAAAAGEPFLVLNSDNYYPADVEVDF